MPAVLSEDQKFFFTTERNQKLDLLPLITWFNTKKQKNITFLTNKSEINGQKGGLTNTKETFSLLHISGR